MNMQAMPTISEKLTTKLWLVGTLWWVVGAVLLLSGCVSKEANRVAIDSIPQPRMPPVEIKGAIYSAGTDISLFEDIRARRVGDILTVMLVEQTAGTKTSDTKMNQSSGISVTPPVVGLNNYTELGVALESKNTFAGDSGSSQTNSLSGSVTVTVTEVLPGGNMRVQGEKWIEINQGKESVKLEGIIRSRDVRPNNTIMSTQVADARISYSGKGSPGHANVMGWVAKLLFSPLRLF
jgi:flagellar L-ring protein FlgH